MSDVFKVSQSKVKTYRRCHRAYHYKYVEKLRKKRKSRPLQFGTMIHEMLELHCNGDDPMDYTNAIRADVAKMKVFKQEREEYGDIIEDVEDIITEYLEYWNYDEGLRFVRKAKRSAEHHFQIEIMPDVIFNGKIDNIVVTPNRLRWLGEHKTYTRRPSNDDRWRNLQSVTYFRANDILGWKPLDGCMWDYVKSKPPVIPGILKDGTLSQKKIDTLPSKIYRILDERGESSKQYPNLMATADANCSNYFERIHTPVNREVADMVFEDFESTVREMVDNHGKCSDMNIDRHCSWCDYEPLCRSLLQGLDVDYIIEKEYLDGTKIKSEYEKAYERQPAHCADLEAVTRFEDQKTR